MKKFISLLVFITQNISIKAITTPRVVGQTYTTVAAPSVTVNTSGDSGGAGGTVGVVALSNYNSGSPDPSTTDVSLDETNIDGTTRLTITTANKNHKLTKTVTYAGTSNPAVTINAHNTVLDLDGRMIQYTGVATSGIHGIVINAGKKNITIKNGIIKDFPGSGIYAVATSGNEIESLTIKNMLIMNNQNGITLDYIKNAVILNNKLHGNTVSSGTVYGLSIANSSSATFNGCEAINNSATSGACYGFKIDSCSNISLEECTANANNGTGQVSGFYITNCSFYNKLYSCKAHGNSSSSGTAHGYLLNSSAQQLIENCLAINNYATGDGQYSYGFKLSSSSNCTLVANQSDRNNYGFHDDESIGNYTNFFTQNIACYNTTANYVRSNSNPISYVTINAQDLRDSSRKALLDNMAITS